MPARGTRDLVLRCLFIAGIASLAFLLGAAVVYFRLPTVELLDDAFTGGMAWTERQQAEAAPVDLSVPKATITVDTPQRTCDGYTAYSTDRGSQALLINMRGDVAHRWGVPFRESWAAHPHVVRPVKDGHIYYFDGHVYPNGDLLAVLHGVGDTPYGYGLIKLDRDSRVVWTYAANAHHSVDVGDDGVIYVLTQKMIHEAPSGLTWLAPPYLADFLVLLAPDGTELRSIPILEAFRDSPFAALLAPATTRSGPAWDPLHTNRATVLRTALAPHFGQFRPGQVLVSMRELNALAVIDTDRKAVVWAARGPWRGQHDPQFLANGRLLVFDNVGFGTASRVLEYDPQTQACPWVYPPTKAQAFLSQIQGRAQRLPNGNTLIVNSHDGDLHEVTDSKQIVWTCACRAHVPWARRYSPTQLPFVNGGHHVRP